MTESSARAGKVVRRYVASDVAASDPAARRRFVEAAIGGRERRRRRTVGWSLVAATAAIFLFVLFGPKHRRAAPLTFAIEGGADAAYLASASDRERVVRFSDGSIVRIAPSARARVAEVGEDGATVVLESGTVALDVVHRASTRWQIACGPFVVHVTGTSFDATWTPATGDLAVKMRSGSVHVTGPGLGDGADVGAGRELHASEAPAGMPSSEPVRAPSPQPPERAPSVVPSAAPIPAATSAQKPVAASREPSWAEDVADGRYDAVLGAAEVAGIDTVLARRGADDLVALADASRFTGHTALARRSLLALRARFAEHPKAKVAAFLLGRLVDDAGGDPREAVRWYDTYVEEAPGGPMVGDAMGRKVLDLRRAKDGEGARDAARAYLARFPKGAYAAAAEEIARP